MGSVVGALAIAPAGFGALVPAPIDTLARTLSALLLVVAAVFVVLGLRWGRRWAV